MGLPVFAGFNGGIGALAGPTGGFLRGFVLGCALAGGVGKSA
ncbi:MAG: biotin transporter BioY [Collinsella sp.]